MGGRTENDRDQLVHLSYSIPLSNGWHGCIVGRCFDSGWLLRFRHHLKMRRRISHIPDLQRKIEKGSTLGMKRSPYSCLLGPDTTSQVLLSFCFLEFHMYRFSFRLDASP